MSKIRMTKLIHYKDPMQMMNKGFWNQICNQVNSKIINQIMDQIRKQTENQLGDQIRHRVIDRVRIGLKPEHSNQK